MAYNRLPKKDIVELCQERGLRVGGFTKAHLIALLEENDRSREQDPVPAGSCQTAPGSVSGAEEGEGADRQMDKAPTRRCSASSSSSWLGSSSADLRTLELELRLKELEAQERQRQHEQAMAELRGRETPAAVRREEPRGAWTVGNVEMNKEEGDVDAFLSAFERTCDLHQFDPMDWFRLLTLFFQDPEAMELLSQMDGGLQGGDYELFKQALEHRFVLTPEEYRKKFRRAQKGPEETYVTLVSRMERYVCKWVVGAGSQITEDLVKLMVLEQLYEICPPDLRLWLMDKNPEDLPSAGRLADAFTDSWPGSEPRRDRLAAVQKGEVPTGVPQKRGISNLLPRGTTATWAAQPARGNRRDLTCHRCGERGHKKAQCPKLQDRRSKPRGPRVNWAGLPLRSECLVPLEVDGRKVTGYWDTGAEVTLVLPEVVAPDHMVPNTHLKLKGINGSSFEVPVARVHLKWGAKEGPMEMGVHPHLPSGVLMGGDLEDWPEGPPSALIVTLSQSWQEALCPGPGEGTWQGMRGPTPADKAFQGAGFSSDTGSERGPVPIPSPAAEFQAELQKDLSLQEWRHQAGLGAAQRLGEGCQERFLWEKGFLYREWVPPGEVVLWGVQRQLVVPQKYRHRLLYLAHDVPLWGHLGTQRTRQRLLQNFYWPGVFGAVQRYCRSCDSCQRGGKAALRPVPIREEPFQKVVMDIVGPFSKVTQSGKKYVLVVVDLATRSPEAVVLPSLEADAVADALLTIFRRVGFPQEMHTDQRSNFISALLQCLWERCGVRHTWASAYHPECSGLVERFNGTLKQMLKTFMHQHPQDWDKYLPHLLFAYKEVPQESIGFSPFELLYGRRARGPLDLIRDEWEGKASPDGDAVVEYVLTFRERLGEFLGLAREDLGRAQGKQKIWYDRTARARAYATGDQVMALIPVRRNKLQAAWDGPFKVAKQLNEVNYVVELPNRAPSHRVYHVNMIKPHRGRENSGLAVCRHLEGL
ncbi:uncharacterized protein LOC142818935 [Pelodiscus sinensis]|uniref:uncharacterized protein LOC142818935 n=1 Tax=Pelodiscus sinensis TaxID=13735 RepID=UPI003F6B3D90